jgi:hypothetical protein
VTFQIEGQAFYALNGGPEFKFTEAISFFVNCETQAVGEGFPLAEERDSVVGLKISLVCRGKSFPLLWAS